MCTIISVNYFSSHLLSGLELQLRAAGDFELLVVDNSGEFSPTLSTTRVVPSGANLGFARACNLGASHAATGPLIFLNPDAQVDAAALRDLVKVIEGNHDVILGPLLYTRGKMPTTLVAQSGFLPFKRVRLRLSDVGSKSRLLPVSYVSGACLVIHSRLFEKLGGFYSRIFMYGEDLEFCLRARDQGADVRLAIDIVGSHVGGGLVLACRVLQKDF